MGFTHLALVLYPCLLHFHLTLLLRQKSLSQCTTSQHQKRNLIHYLSVTGRGKTELRRDSRARLHQNLHYLEGFRISEYLAGNPVSMVPFTTCPLSHPIHLYASNKIPFIRSCTVLQSFQIFITWLFSFGKWTCSYNTLATTNHSLNKVSSDLIKPEETRSHTAWVFCRNS